MRFCRGGIIVRVIRGNMGSFVFERGQRPSALLNLTEQQNVQRQRASYLNPSVLRKIGLVVAPLTPLLPNSSKVRIHPNFLGEFGGL